VPEVKLDVGTRLGELTIIAELEGGEVARYRVRDDDGTDAELFLMSRDVELERRAAGLCKLRHENLHAVFEAGEWEGRTYLVRELVTGWSVASWLEREGRLRYDQALGIACQLCLASTEAAKAGVGFLGLSPDSIIVDSSGFARADPLRIFATDDDSYKSPEEKRSGAADQKSDVFRIGLMLYRMLSGRMPQRDGSGRVVYQPLSAVDNRLPPELDTAIEVSLSEFPEARYADADKFLDRLHELLMRRPGSASAGPPRWHEDKRFWLYVAVALAAVVAVMALVFGLPPFPFGGW